MDTFGTLRSRKGSAFITVMVCMLLMTIAGGYMYQATTQNSHFTGIQRRSAEAQAVAEAGLAAALARVRSNWALINSGFPNGTVGDGSYSTTVVTSGGRYLIKTTGTVQGYSRTASAEVKAPATGALNYAFAGGGVGSHIVDVGTGQSNGTISGDVYGAGNFTLDGPANGGGGVLAVTGSLYASQTATAQSNTTISGSTNSNWTNTVTFPTVDFNYYKTIAQTNGQYFNSKTYASGTLPAAPAGGVIFINGDLTIRGTQSTRATIIATGNITIEKTGNIYPRVTINQYSNYPAMMTQNGEIVFTSTGNGGAYLNTTGLVYAGNNLHINSGNHDTFTFTGSVISRAEIQIDLQGQCTLTATYVAQNPPGITTAGNSTTSIVSYNN